MKIGKSCCGSYLRIAISVRRRSKGMLEGKKGLRSTFIAIHQGFSFIVTLLSLSLKGFSYIAALFPLSYISIYSIYSLKSLSSEAFTLSKMRNLILEYSEKHEKPFRVILEKRKMTVKLFRTISEYSEMCEKTCRISLECSKIAVKSFTDILGYSKMRKKTF